MEEKLAKIKEWLGSGSINIFGLPMSGKDTQGVMLAQALGAKLLSSGMIIRAKEAETRQNLTDNGNLLPTNMFYDWVLPYFERPDLFKQPLILSSIGRWYGEENAVMSAAAGAGHEIMAVILLNVSEKDVESRFESAKILNDRGDRDRGDRKDDDNIEVFRNRMKEFREKTLPVLYHYRDLDLLIEVNGNQERDKVFNEIVEKLYEKASQSPA